MHSLKNKIYKIEMNEFTGRKIDGNFKSITNILTTQQNMYLLRLRIKFDDNANK